jgi:hypothetical protein
MSDQISHPRYLLGSLEDRGVMLGLNWDDLTILAVVGALVVVMVLVLPALAALPLSVIFGLVASAAVFWRIDGWRVHQYLRLWWRYNKTQKLRVASEIPDEFDGLSLLAVESSGGSSVGVIHDERASTWTAVIATGSTNVALVGEEERARHLAKWAAILDQLSYAGSALYRLAWVAAVWPDPGDKIANWFLAHAPAEPSSIKAAYARLLTEAAPRAETHEIHLVVQIHEGRAAREICRAGGGRDGSLRVLLNEVDHLCRALVRADIPVVGLLSPVELAVQLRMHWSPNLLGRMLTRQSGLHPSEAFCPDLNESWDHVRTDNALHYSAWVSGMPRQAMPPDFLVPLLLQGGCYRRLAVIMEPIDAERAGREAQREVTGLETDVDVLGRGGFRVNAVRRRGVIAARRREEELAAGASDWRFSMFLTVSATDAEGLDQAKGIAERAAARSRLRLCPLNGQQAKGLMATSVLGVGLTPERRGTEVGVAKRAMRLPAHRCSSAHICALYPFAPPPSTGEAGIYIGTDPIGGASFCFDPFTAYETGLVTSTNMMVTGEIGKSKSSLIKTLCLRMAAFGRRVVVVDPKGEYTPVAEALDIQPWKLVPFGPTRLNPIDPGPIGALSDEERRRNQLGLLASLLEASLERRLAPEEHTALSIGLSGASLRAEVPTIRDVVAALIDPDPTASKQASVTVEQIRQDGRALAHELRRLCDGDLAGLFDGETTVRLDNRAHVILDLSHLYGTPALPLAMLCAMSWLRQSFMDPTGPRTFFVLDEAYAVLTSKAIARWMTVAWKLSRAYGLACCFVAHRISDLGAVGDIGSEASQRAENLVADSGIRVFYGQPHEQAQLAGKTFGLSDYETHLIETIPRGVALWRIGGRSYLVRHVLSSLERPIVDTDSRLVASTVVNMPERHRPGQTQAGRGAQTGLFQ